MLLSVFFDKYLQITLIQVSNLDKYDGSIISGIDAIYYYYYYCSVNIIGPYWKACSNKL